MRCFQKLTILAAALPLAACVQPAPPPQPGFGAQPQVPTYAPAYPTVPPSRPSSPAMWRAAGAPESEPLAAGGARRFVIRATNGASKIDLHLVAFDSRQCGIRVIDQPQPHAGGGVIAEAMRAHRAVAGANGGFFTPEFQPLGLMIAGGAKTGTLSSTKLLSGMFLSAGGQPYLIWRGEYAGSNGIIDLVQAGPRLVDAGAPVGGLEKNSPRTRTFIVTDGHHGWALGVARSTTLGDLAELLASPDVIPGIRVARALNLDGGHSSAIWMHTARGAQVSEPGWSTVRNFIAIVPR